MYKLLSLTAASLCAVAAVAQTPSCNGTAPAGSLTTLFGGGVYLGATSATAGFNQMFDLVTNSPLTISQIDLHFYDNGVPVTNPVLVGLTTGVEFWTCPTASAGNETIQANWTLRGSGTVTIQANGTHSPAIFTPFLLPAGPYGAVVHVNPVLDPVSNTNVGAHPLYTNPATTPGTATVYSDQYMTLTARGFQGTAWTGIPALRVINTQIFYQPGVNAGYTTKFGAGCYNRPQTFYEYLVGPGQPAFTTYDLSNTTMSLLNQGNSYLVIPGSAAYTAPTSVALTTVGATYDDDISAPQALPWSFPFPGGSTTSVIVSTNGHVFLGASTATFGPYAFSAFFTDVPRLAAAWMDLDLTSQGSMHFEVDPGNAFVRITWQNAPEWDPLLTIPGLGSNTFQMVLYPNGNVDYIYNTITVYNCPLAVGFARGQGTIDPGSQDLSATMPFVAGDGQVPAVLGMDARPVTGTTPNFVCTNIQPGTIFGVMAMSFGGLAGSPLGAFGMPGCFQYVALPAVTVFAGVVGGAVTVPLGLPNDPSYNGVNLFAQCAPLTPGLNAANIVTSNGLCVHIGIN